MRRLRRCTRSSPLLGIKKPLGGNVKVEYAPGYYIPGKEAQGAV